MSKPGISRSGGKSPRHDHETALEACADIKALAEVAGSSPETLRKYYQHVSTELRRQTVAKIPEIPIPKPKSDYTQNSTKKAASKSGLSS
jgi:hypothetical protein